MRAGREEGNLPPGRDGGAPARLHGCCRLPPALQLCLWQISVPVGHVIDLHFHNFSLESHEDCSFDFVEVHDSAGTGAASLMGRYRHSPGISSPAAPAWAHWVPVAQLGKLRHGAGW